MQDLQIICTRLYFIAELEEGVCFSFHVKSSMHDRVVTAKAANDRKARNEPSDIEMDLRTSRKRTKLYRTA